MGIAVAVGRTTGSVVATDDTAVCVGGGGRRVAIDIRVGAPHSDHDEKGCGVMKHGPFCYHGLGRTPKNCRSAP